MSIEVDAHRYQYLPRRLRGSTDIRRLKMPFSLKLIDAAKNQGQSLESVPPPSNISPVLVKHPSPPFTYNPLHDMESLWWLALYLLIARRYEALDDSVDLVHEKQMHQQIRFAEKFFYNSTSRLAIMTGNGFRRDLDQLDLHDAVYASASELDDALLDLQDLFREVEKNIGAIKFSSVCSKTNERGQDLYDAMYQAFDNISKIMRQENCHAVVDSLSTKVRKRGRADDMENQRIGDKRHAVTMVDAESSQPLPSLLSYAQSHKARKMHKDSTPGSSSRRPDTESDGSR
jgi:hypothetical protein